MHTIKPIDKKQIIKSSLQTKIFVSIEEHSTIGGLGSSIAEETSSFKNNIRLIRLGLKDSYNISGEYDFILNKNGLTVDKITKKLIKELVIV